MLSIRPTWADSLENGFLYSEPSITWRETIETLGHSLDRLKMKSLADRSPTQKGLYLKKSEQICMSRSLQARITSPCSK